MENVELSLAGKEHVEQILILILCAWGGGDDGCILLRQPTMSFREPRRKALEGRSHDVIPAVTHVQLKMRGAPGGRPGGALSIYDVAINARDPSARSDF